MAILAAGPGLTNRHLLVQSSAAAMLLHLLNSILRWAMRIKPTICREAWAEAVCASYWDPKSTHFSKVWPVLKVLIDGIEDPLLVLLGKLPGCGHPHGTCPAPPQAQNAF